MVTIAHHVRKIIERKPFLQEALSRGIVNNAALAEQLIPELEKELRKKVKFSAVNMAIRRLAEELEKTFTTKTTFGKSDVTVKSNLIEIVLYKTQDVQERIKKLYEFIDLRKGDFLTITQGLHELMIITNEKHEKKTLDTFPKTIVKKVIRTLSSATIQLPEESINTIGLFYLATRALNWENINIIDIVSTFTEMTFIIKEEDAPRAFETLRELIKTHA
ncbi:hypothetical protein J4219_00110 [Candidatus Woesearchaeota archaeon]|nr:hypothetical protein [Candidatus Woesearchaeota archaeon]